MKKEVKSIQLEIKSIDKEKGLVTAYFSTWDKDRDNDVIEPNAYDKTFKEQKDYIYHNIDHDKVIGKPIDFGTDEKGAWFTSQLALGTVDGADAYEKYKAKLITGHSQEYQAVQSHMKQGVRHITEVRLWGVTSMTKIPANPEATTISVKGISDKLTPEEFLVEYKKLTDLMLEYKNKGLAMAGVVHCENCKTIVPVPVQSDERKDDAGGMEAGPQMKCPGCGRFVNAKTGKMETNKKSFLSLDTLMEFKGKKEDGKVIGTTYSDKPIHAEPEHKGHEQFDDLDHIQAFNKHIELARAEVKSAQGAETDKEKNDHMDAANDHVDKAGAHMKMAFKCMK